VLGSGEQVPVVIKNISRTGCRIEFGENTQPAGRIRLMEQSLALDAWANVVWRGDGACGLAFEDIDQLLDSLTSLKATVVSLNDLPAPKRSGGKGRLSIRKR
jgi:hypothetical protein